MLWLGDKEGGGGELAVEPSAGAEELLAQSKVVQSSSKHASRVLFVFGARVVCVCAGLIPPAARELVFFEEAADGLWQ